MCAHSCEAQTSVLSGGGADVFGGADGPYLSAGSPPCPAAAPSRCWTAPPARSTCGHAPAACSASRIKDHMAHGCMHAPHATHCHSAHVAVSAWRLAGCAHATLQAYLCGRQLAVACMRPPSLAGGGAGGRHGVVVCEGIKSGGAQLDARGGLGGGGQVTQRAAQRLQAESQTGKGRCRPSCMLPGHVQRC